MGSCVSSPSPPSDHDDSSGERSGGGPSTPEKLRSQAIDRQIAEDERNFKKECKILLLGSGESGKSTIVKQMKIIHLHGYSTEELVMYRAVVNRNIVESAQALILAMRKFGLDCELSENRVTPSTLPASLAFAIHSLWNDPVMPALIARANEFYLMDSAPYFFERANLERICKRDYVPTQDDVLRSRVKTTGITETRFAMGPLLIHMFDVGGQRSERKKWIHCFESVTSIIFCVALSEYDQVLLEERQQNRMKESLALFDGVVNSRWFFSTSIILFLNKKDVFQEKLPRVPLIKYFPEYAGGADHNKAAKFILWKFTQANRARLSIYPHLTQATDTRNIRLVFAAVKETILHNALKDAGIM
ncbi:guanine nucleotide-binding protein alpha-3 subunit [Clavulina sp. PMI_390]|nr:guanine nucleotide-binding protein alpha-3 subunit [Clavulina sp. PMI_390]